MCQLHTTLRICNGAAKEGKIDYFWRSATAYTLVLAARQK
jgi:hypothetical protein